jgi:hypothetical protein
MLGVSLVKMFAAFGGLMRSVRSSAITDRQQYNIGLLR